MFWWHPNHQGMWMMQEKDPSGWCLDHENSSLMIVEDEVCLSPIWGWLVCIFLEWFYLWCGWIWWFYQMALHMLMLEHIGCSAQIRCIQFDRGGLNLLRLLFVVAVPFCLWASLSNFQLLMQLLILVWSNQLWLISMPSFCLVESRMILMVPWWRSKERAVLFRWRFF